MMQKQSAVDPVSKPAAFRCPHTVVGLLLCRVRLSGGAIVADPDEISLVNNFAITPMIFFCGSFFPIQNLPPCETYCCHIAAELSEYVIENGFVGILCDRTSLLLGTAGMLLLWGGVQMLKQYNE